MIDEVNYYLIMECHLYCYKMFVDCNNNYTVHYTVFHMMLMDYNKMKDDYMHMIVENLNKPDDNNKESCLVIVLEDNNIEMKVYNLDYTLMDEEIVERDNVGWLLRYLR